MKNLQKRSLTSQSNGYPVPEIGTITYGFDTIKEAELYIKENGGEMGTAGWKDGWDNAHYQGMAYESFQIESSEYGDNYDIYDECMEWYELIGYTSEQEATESAEEEEIERAKELHNDLKDVDFSKYQALIHDGEMEDTIPIECLYQVHDTKHQVIGVCKFYE